VMNTVQLYRKDRYDFMVQSFEELSARNVVVGMKLVRGAYMEKERARAKKMGYDSPIQTDKQACDTDYNRAAAFCLNNVERMSFCVASHNEFSNFKTATDALAQNIPSNHPHLHFSQLYGMSDNITFNLAREGYNVTKYLPYGPVRDVIPYLMRRAQENTSIGGQTSRELQLINKELKRRRAVAA
jgi:proline dehydrogenase